MILALLVSAFTLAEDLSGSWHGSYSYDQPDKGVPFQVELVDGGTRLTGTIIEPNTFGEKNAKELKAKLDGRLEGDKISFKKTYDGTGKVNHDVFYQGTLRDGKITGTWHIADASGPFVMERGKGAKVAAPPKNKKPEPKAAEVPAAPLL